MTPGRPPLARGALLPDLARRAAVVGSAVAVTAVAAVPDPSRPVLTPAALTVAAALAAAVLRRRMLGTLTVLLATLTVLLAGALDASAARPAQVLAAAALLVVLVTTLAACEDSRGAGTGTVTVATAPAPTRLAPAGLALLAGVVVAVTAGQDVVPSVWLVLAGLAAAVAALVVAAGVHRA